jgi:hypothetical protein
MAKQLTKEQPKEPTEPTLDLTPAAEKAAQFDLEATEAYSFQCCCCHIIFRASLQLMGVCRACYANDAGQGA